MDSLARSSLGNAGRAGHRYARSAQDVLRRLRLTLAGMFHCPGDHVVLGHSGTDMLNLAIQGALRPGDHVVMTALEHNSVLRPLRRLAESLGLALTQVAPNEHGVVTAESVAAALTKSTRLVCVTHASNVTGMIQPIEAIGAKIQESASKPLFLVDAAQTAGILPIDMRVMHIDMLVFSGHKGLLGPQGTGVLCLGERFAATSANPSPFVLAPLRVGGSGDSSQAAHPSGLPAALEAGTANALGASGLLAGAEYLLGRGLEVIRTHELQLTEALLAGLAALPSVQVYGSSRASDRVATVSFSCALSPHEVAAILDSSFDIAVRAGLQCAPDAHAVLGTQAEGTVRASLGPMSTEGDVVALLAALREILGS
jgi:cysteine desulfurase / selenocysteine lyase